MSKVKGLHEYRFAQNPEERRISNAFKRYAKGNLGWLLHVGDQSGRAPTVNVRDEAVAYTAIQWLGSTVGQQWLRDLGYVREGGG